MATVYSILIEGGDTSDWWDGTESWGGESDESGRDTKYSTRVYTSITSWYTDRDGNSTSGDTEILNVIGPFSSKDDTAVYIVSGVATYWQIKCPITLVDSQANPARHAGIWDESNCFVWRNNDTDTEFIRVREQYFEIDGIQIEVVASSSNSRKGIVHNSNIAATNAFLYENIIFKGTCSGTGLAYGFESGDSDSDIELRNCLFYDFVSGADSHFRAIYCHYGTFDINNCTIHNCRTGMLLGSATATVKNTAVFDCNDDFDGSFGVTYSASDDGDCDDGTCVSPSGSDWANEFPDYATDDFNIDDGGNLYDAGTDLSGTFDYDVAGNPRTSTFSIGAFEYVAGVVGGLSIEVNDKISTSESLTRGMPLGALSKHEALTISELRDLLVSISPSVFENMTIIEFMSAVMTINPDVFESINITEFATVIRDSHLVDKYENITIEEFNSLAMNMAMNLPDIITIIEDVSASIRGDSTISESEAVTIIENIQAAMLLGAISASEIVTITEDVSAIVSALAQINVNASDVINIVEDISGVMTIQVSFFDLIKISEFIIINLPAEISVADELKITEHSTVDVLATIDGVLGVDLITLTEYVMARFDWELAQAHDVISITEAIVALTGGFGWSTSQLVSITEYVLVSMVSFVLHNYTARTRRFNFNAATRGFDFNAKTR